MSCSASSSGSPAPTRKRKQDDIESSDVSDSDERSAEEEEEEEDTPRPLPTTEHIVLSHAERRRQKKREKRNQLSESQTPRKKRKLDDGTHASPVIDAAIKTNTKTGTKIKGASTDDSRRHKRQNSVWVGNLSYRTTQEALRGFFDGVGTITRVHMPMRRGKEGQNDNMGFAYVDFEKPEAKVIAITLSEGQLDGRNLLIKDGDDFAGRPTKAETEPGREGEAPAKNATTTDSKGLSKTTQKILRAQKQPPAPTLFLGNLGFATTDASIRELFEAHRNWRRNVKKKDGTERREEDEEEGDAAKSKDVWIRKIRMGTFEDSGNCKGFAFVDFTSIEHATEALVNPRNHRLNGRDLVVEYASPDAVRRGGGPRNPKGDRDRKSTDRSGAGRVPKRGDENPSNTKSRRPRHIEREEVVETSVEATTPRSDSQRPDRAGHDRSHTRRARPGAALAHAQRQSVAILPGQGQKITF